MRFSNVANTAALLALASSGHAQFPPTPEGVTVRDSKFGDGVQLSWKEVRLLAALVLRHWILTAAERHLRDHGRRSKLHGLRASSAGQFG
jgi:hypothetical protein